MRVASPRGYFVTGNAFLTELCELRALASEERTLADVCTGDLLVLLI